ncbi:phage membrane protein [Streptococcus pyogenes]|nr:phage membrane protein [Streptococcus pyogenes]SQF63627.1 phage membrane protein [Streptococcus pyogenes]SUO64310.1 phage membrane protein [Streptococcus pyogenes]SUO64814.1 phage membrane protein [Streptococcus pyogenes]SUO68418.1 phage membrane protein [Streptococcus pyogenes]
MRAITQIALVIAIAIIYIPLAVVALIFYPFFEEEEE